MLETVRIQVVGKIAHLDGGLVTTAITVAATVIVATDHPAIAITGHIHVFADILTVISPYPGIAEIMGQITGWFDEIRTVMYQPPLHIYFITIWNIQGRQSRYFPGCRIGRITPGIGG